MSNIMRITRNIKASTSTFMLAIIAGASPSYALEKTAGNIMSDFSVAERVMYISGAIDGLAYARFRYDTLTKGERDQAGMECILRWFSEGSLSRLMEIERAFEAYADEYPLTILGVMVKQECGE